MRLPEDELIVHARREALLRKQQRPRQAIVEFFKLILVLCAYGVAIMGALFGVLIVAAPYLLALVAAAALIKYVWF